MSQRHVDLHVWSSAGIAIHSRFHRNPFKGFGASGSRICPLPLTWPLAYTTACTAVQAVKHNSLSLQSTVGQSVVVEEKLGNTAIPSANRRAAL